MGARVFVSWPGYDAADPDTGARLVAAGHTLSLAPKLGARSPEELSALMGDAEAAIVSTDPFTRQVLEAHRSLRVIARVGVGTDSIDHAPADQLGVAIAVTPGLNAEPVADQTLAMILALIRKVVAQDGTVKRGGWERVGALTPSELPGKVVGLVGAGIIGQAVIRRLRGFGCRILFLDGQVERVEGAERVATLEDLLSRSDVVSLHAPLVPETARLIRRETIEVMRPGALLVNTARGGLVDQGDLFAALRSGRLGGAALDVFEVEPPGAEVADVPNLVCSAHIGGLSHESIRRMTVSATESVLAILAGERPHTVINPTCWDRRDA
jgi:phosphoglycerate dehydrogenase-like enzyme